MKKLFVLLLLPLWVISCGKGPETTTVRSGGLVPGAADTTNSQKPVPAAEKNEEFIQYTLGEFNHIHSLDPLFAENNSELRILSLIYDRLVKINSLGNYQPSLAKRWEVNGDSTRFIFHLRTNIYYHDSNVFDSGIGRKFVAGDLKFIFERMASVSVPDHAYEMFKNIRGFEQYHNEQTFVKDPRKRIVDSINGIEVRNDSTVVFIMKKRSGNFIRNLAHPMASVYPRESTRRTSPPLQQAAGTGPFYLVKKEQDRHILSLYRDYAGSLPELNRLDFVSGLSDKDFFQSFASGDIDILMEITPPVVLKTITREGELYPGYSEKYSLDSTGINSRHILYYNRESGKESPLNRFLNSLNPDSLTGHPGLGSVQVFPPGAVEDSASATNDTGFSIAHTDERSELYLVDRFATLASEAGFNTAMNASYAIADDVTFSTRQFPNTQKVLRWNKPVYLLMQPSVSGISFNRYPWNLDLSDLNKNGGN